MDGSLNVEIANYKREMLNFTIRWIIANIVLLVLVCLFCYFSKYKYIYY